MNLPPQTAIPPDKLDKIVDQLVVDPAAILRWSTLNRLPSSVQIDVVVEWQGILIQAKDRETEKAPKLFDYLSTIGGGTVAIIGFGLMAAPVGVLAAAGAGIGVFSGGLSLLGAAKLLKSDDRSMRRLWAIQSAELLIAERLASLRRHNQPPQP